MRIRRTVMVYRCTSDWNNCSWSTTNYAEVDAHEYQLEVGHFVTGRHETIYLYDGHGVATGVDPYGLAQSA